MPFKFITLIFLNKRFMCVISQLNETSFQNDGLSENEHQLSVAGKIKKHFNTGPRPGNNTSGVSVMTVRSDTLMHQDGCYCTSKHELRRQRITRGYIIINDTQTEIIKRYPLSCNDFSSHSSTMTFPCRDQGRWITIRTRACSG